MSEIYPLVSIITINLNNAKGLEKTIESIKSQNYKNFEYIVIDGASSDESVCIIRKNIDLINIWISEKDRGVYNAMNKGIKLSKGDYLLFLNSGDSFFENSSLYNLINVSNDNDIVYGNLMNCKNNLNLYTSVYPNKLTFNHFFNDSLPHPASLIKKNLFDVFGHYDENYSIVSDWFFFIKVILIHNASYVHVNKIISYFELGGFSNNEIHSQKSSKERQFILKSNFPFLYDDYLSYNQLKKDLFIFNHSRIIKICMKIINSKLYKRIVDLF